MLRFIKPRGQPSVYHFMEMSAIFNPSFQEVIEIRVEERRREDEDGELLDGVDTPAQW